MYILLKESPFDFYIQSDRRLDLWDGEEVQALRRPSEKLSLQREPPPCSLGSFLCLPISHCW